MWDEIDFYKHGAINGNHFTRWFEGEGGFAIPPNNVHMIYDAFKSKEYEHKITFEQWYSALAGPQASEEGPGPQMEAQDPAQDLNERDNEYQDDDFYDDNQSPVTKNPKNSSPSKSGSKMR